MESSWTRCHWRAVYLSFEISMQDLSIVDMLERQWYLNEPVQDLGKTRVQVSWRISWRDGAWTYLVLWYEDASGRLEPGMKIASITVVHHDEQVAHLFERLHVGHNVRMLHLCKDRYFLSRFGSLLGPHLARTKPFHLNPKDNDEKSNSKSSYSAHIDLLDDERLGPLVGLDKPSLSKSAFADLFYQFVIAPAHLWADLAFLALKWIADSHWLVGPSMGIGRKAVVRRLV